MTASLALGLTGGLFFSVISIWKGRNQISKNNTKAGYANLISGAAGIGVVLLTVGAMYAPASMAMVLFAVNIFLFVITVLASILASVFYLDYLQSFLTCTVFSIDKKVYSENIYLSKYARRNLFENRAILTEVYTREELNSYKREIPMSDFRNMLQWLINLQYSFGGHGRLHGYNSFNYQNIEYRYPYFVTFKLQFRYFMPNSMLDLHLVLYPLGIDQSHYNFVIPANNNASSNYVNKEDDGFFSVERTFRVGTQIEELLQKVKDNSPGTHISLNTCCYILYARIISKDGSQSAINYPYSPTGETVYVAFHETLFVKPNSGCGATISKYSGQRHAENTGRAYFSVGDPQVLIGSKQEIYKQIQPLKIR